MYNAFGFELMTLKFGKVTNVWMLFKVTGQSFNSIDFKYLYPVPCSFRTWVMEAHSSACSVPGVTVKYYFVTFHSFADVLILVVGVLQNV